MAYSHIMNVPKGVVSTETGDRYISVSSINIETN